VFSALLCSSPLPVPALTSPAAAALCSLAAHAVVSQLWNLISYAVDGFAAAGIVLGSRLAAQARDPRRAASAKLHLLRLIKRTLGAGLMAGMASGAAFAVWRVDVIAAFTSDPTTIAALRDGTWAVLCLAQPINGLVFVFDGLMYASQNFRFIRNYMLLGFAFVFCPVMALQALLVQKLWFVWLAAAVINIWRAGGAAYLIFFIFFHDFDAQLADGEAEGAV
jgi:Na+-driven multidrug efflux pump